jgi:hypothetical protein
MRRTKAAPLKLRAAWQSIPIAIKRWIYLVVSIVPGLAWLFRDALGLSPTTMDIVAFTGLAALVAMFALDTR